ncbi:MAG: thiamine pyrophosphate-dependent enzyme, partial [Thermoplasmata archaeon]
MNYEDFEFFAPGHRACAGCAAPIIVKWVLKVSGPKTIVVNATGCLEVFSTPYPHTAWRVPWIHTAFENAAATASGIDAALKSLGKRDDINIIVFGGDGGTSDIGFQSLSGMAERGHNILYILYDNEAYMNTGIQRSSSTPFGAWTS